jgi:hypothetical protein
MTKCGEKKKVILKCGMTKLFEVFAEAWHVQCMSGLFFLHAVDSDVWNKFFLAFAP